MDILGRQSQLRENNGREKSTKDYSSHSQSKSGFSLLSSSKSGKRSASLNVNNIENNTNKISESDSPRYRTNSYLYEDLDFDFSDQPHKMSGDAVEGLLMKSNSFESSTSNNVSSLKGEGGMKARGSSDRDRLGFLPRPSSFTLNKTLTRKRESVDSHSREPPSRASLRSSPPSDDRYRDVYNRNTAGRRNSVSTDSSLEELDKFENDVLKTTKSKLTKSSNVDNVTSKNRVKSLIPSVKSRGSVKPSLEYEDSGPGEYYGDRRSVSRSVIPAEDGDSGGFNAMTLLKSFGRKVKAPLSVPFKRNSSRNGALKRSPYISEYDDYDFDGLSLDEPLDNEPEDVLFGDVRPARSHQNSRDIRSDRFGYKNSSEMGMNHSRDLSHFEVDGYSMLSRQGNGRSFPSHGREHVAAISEEEDEDEEELFDSETPRYMHTNGEDKKERNPFRDRRPVGNESQDVFGARHRKVGIIDEEEGEEEEEEDADPYHYSPPISPTKSASRSNLSAVVGSSAVASPGSAVASAASSSVNEKSVEMSGASFLSDPHVLSPPAASEGRISKPSDPTRLVDNSATWKEREELLNLQNQVSELKLELQRREETLLSLQRRLERTEQRAAALDGLSRGLSAAAVRQSLDGWFDAACARMQLEERQWAEPHAAAHSKEMDRLVSRRAEAFFTRLRALSARISRMEERSLPQLMWGLTAGFLSLLVRAAAGVLATGLIEGCSRRLLTLKKTFVSPDSQGSGGFHKAGNLPSSSQSQSNYHSSSHNNNSSSNNNNSYNGLATDAASVGSHSNSFSEPTGSHVRSRSFAPRTTSSNVIIPGATAVAESGRSKAYLRASHRLSTTTTSPSFVAGAGAGGGNGINVSPVTSTKNLKNSDDSEESEASEDSEIHRRRENRSRNLNIQQRIPANIKVTPAPPNLIVPMPLPPFPVLNSTPTLQPSPSLIPLTAVPALTLNLPTPGATTSTPSSSSLAAMNPPLHSRQAVDASLAAQRPPALSSSIISNSNSNSNSHISHGGNVVSTPTSTQKKISKAQLGRRSHGNLSMSQGFSSLSFINGGK